MTTAALAALSEALEHTGEITSQTANPEYRASIAQSVRPALELQDRSAVEAVSAGREPSRTMRRARGHASRVCARRMTRALWRSSNCARSASTTASDPRIAELQRTTATLYRDIAERRFQLATREDRFGPDDASARALREDISRLRARLGVANAELAARAAPTSRRASGHAPDWIARALAEPCRPSASIEYWIGATSAYAWTIARGQLSWVRLESSAQIDKAARNLHEAMRSYASTPRHGAARQRR